MIQIKAIKDWKYVFLDTSVIIDYLCDATKYAKNPPQQNRIEKVQKLFDKILFEIKDLTFCISAITLAELNRGRLEDNIIVEMIGLFGSVEFIDFNASTAILLQKDVTKYLGEGKKNQFMAELAKTLKENSIMSARQWLLDDLKIVACAKIRHNLGQLDVILTSDTKTFVPFAQKFQLPCLTSLDIPLDMFGNIDTNTKITIQ